MLYSHFLREGNLLIKALHYPKPCGLQVLRPFSVERHPAWLRGFGVWFRGEMLLSSTGTLVAVCPLLEALTRPADP